MRFCDFKLFCSLLTAYQHVAAMLPDELFMRDYALCVVRQSECKWNSCVEG